MSQENVENLSAAWDRWNKGDVTAALALLDPEVVFEDFVLPDHAGDVFRGHEGVLKALARWAESWEGFETELEWVRDAGAEVVSSHFARLRGRGSGVDTEVRYAYAWRFRAGRVVYLRNYADVDEALKAVGLPG